LTFEILRILHLTLDKETNHAKAWISKAGILKVEADKGKGYSMLDDEREGLLMRWW